MAEWFTSDLRFGDKRIIQHANRPFRSVDEMDEALISNWNCKVNTADTVYVVGNFAKFNAADYAKALNGRIVLIWGNNDARTFKHPFKWAGEVYLHRAGKQLIWLAHYAHRVWPQKQYGAWHLYGHSCGKLADEHDSRSMDVGIDTHAETSTRGLLIQDFNLYSYDEIAAHMACKHIIKTAYETAQTTLGA